MAIIKLLNEEAPYLFCLTQMMGENATTLPVWFIELLEHPTVVKVGNRVNVDVRKMQEWGVELGPTSELGHLAQSRAVTRHKNPSLATIVGNLWPGIELAGKEPGAGARISDWSARLNKDQEDYANNDGYTEGVAYQRLVQIMDPKVQAPLNQEEVAPGLHVTLYSCRWTSRVMEGALEGTVLARGNVIVEVDVSSSANIFAPGYHVQTVDANSNLSPALQNANVVMFDSQKLQSSSNSLP